MLDQWLDNTDRSAAQTERILRARWSSGSRKETNQRIQSVSKSYGESGFGFRNGLVLFTDRLGNILLFAAAQRIFLADNPLQGSHLRYHLCDKVRFCQVRCPTGKDGIVVFELQHGDQLIDKIADALGLIQIRAQLGMEGQAGQFWTIGLVRLLDI